MGTLARTRRRTRGENIVEAFFVFTVVVLTGVSALSAMGYDVRAALFGAEPVIVYVDDPNAPLPGELPPASAAAGPAPEAAASPVIEEPTVDRTLGTGEPGAP